MSAACTCERGNPRIVQGYLKQAREIATFETQSCFILRAVRCSCGQAYLYAFTTSDMGLDNDAAGVRTFHEISEELLAEILSMQPEDVEAHLQKVQPAGRYVRWSTDIGIVLGTGPLEPFIYA